MGWARDRAFRATQFALRGMFAAGYRVRIAHRDRVPKRGGLLIVSNHQSHFDPPFVGCWLPRVAWFVARDSLFRGGFGRMIAGYNAIPIRRGEADAATMRAVIGHLKQGRAVTLFPEGTRSESGEVGAFQRGLAVLIKRSGCDVLPVGIDGLREVWPKGARRPTIGGRIAVVYGEVMPAAQLASMKADQAVALLRDRVIDLRHDAAALVRRR